MIAHPILGHASPDTSNCRANCWILRHKTHNHTINTTYNNPLDTTDKILNTDHPTQVSSTLQILESLAGDTPGLMVVPDIISVTEVDGVNARNRVTRDPGDNLVAGGRRSGGAAAADAGHNPVPITGTRKRTCDISRSSDKTHKKIRDENGTIRKW